jgi:hypothetical protein
MLISLRTAAMAFGAAIAAHAPAWAQAAEDAAKDDKGPGLAFWIAIAVPIVLGVGLAIRAASSKKKP